MDVVLESGLLRSRKIVNIEVFESNSHDLLKLVVEKDALIPSNVIFVWRTRVAEPLDG